jgi:hypothetical protein
MNDATDTTPEVKATKATKAKPIIIRVRVLSPSLQIGGGTAARGRVLNVSQAVAEFHEQRAEVLVLGTL